MCAKERAKLLKVLTLMLIGGLALLLSTQCVQSAFTKEDCNEIAANNGSCTCAQKKFNVYQINCSESENNIKIEKNTLTIICQRRAPAMLLLPDPIRLADFVALKINNCTLADEQLQQLFESEPQSKQRLLRLSLEGNNIQQLHSDTLGMLSNLQKLELLENAVQQLGGQLLSKNAKLLDLKLSWQQTALPHDLLHNLTALSNVVLSGHIAELRADSFKNVTQLESLELAQLKLNILPAQLLTALKQLRSLKLNNNSFDLLPPELLKENQQLEVFSLMNHIPLKSLPAPLLANLPHLKELKLDCGLVELQPILYENSSLLTRLELHNNNLTELHTQLLAGQRELVTLSLRHNNLASVPAQLLRYNKKLEAFTLLNQRQIKTLPPSLLANLPELVYVEISCDLESIAVEFLANSKQLKELNLRNNRLRKLPPALLSQQPALAVLNLAHNQLSYIVEGALKPLLQYAVQMKVNLSDNGISTLDYEQYEVIANYSGFADLSLNNISNVDWLSRPELTFSKYYIPLDLSGNPIDCNCAMLNLKLYSQDGCQLSDCSLAFIQAHYIQCYTPPSLRNRRLKDVNALDLLCALPPANCSASCSCGRRTYDNTLLVNCTDANLQAFPALPDIQAFNLSATELHIAHNQLSNLTFAANLNRANVTKIFAAHNQIADIFVEEAPTNLVALELHHNRLQHLSSNAANALRPLKSVSLAANDWACDCRVLPLLEYIMARSFFINDLDDINCATANAATNITSLAKLTPGVICPTAYALIIWPIVMALLLATIGFVAYKHKFELKVWLYARGLCLRYITEEELDSRRIFDAFISYSHHDETFLLEHLVPQLENGSPSYKLCIDVRHWLAGELIPECIVRSCLQSKRVIIVLSKHFVDSIWGRTELRMAHEATLRERRARVIVIVFDDVLAELDLLDDELRMYLKINIYLRWGEPLFWEKLRYAMPHACAPLDETKI